VCVRWTCAWQLSNARYENTYQVGPPDRRFEWPSVETMLSKLLASVLRGHKYEPRASARAAVDIANAARTRLRALALPRYTSARRLVETF